MSTTNENEIAAGEAGQDLQPIPGYLHELYECHLGHFAVLSYTSPVDGYGTSISALEHDPMYEDGLIGDFATPVSPIFQIPLDEQILQEAFLNDGLNLSGLCMDALISDTRYFCQEPQGHITSSLSHEAGFYEGNVSMGQSP